VGINTVHRLPSCLHPAFPFFPFTYKRLFGLQGEAGPKLRHALSARRTAYSLFQLGVALVGSPGRNFRTIRCPSASDSRSSIVPSPPHNRWV